MRQVPNKIFQSRLSQLSKPKINLHKQINNESVQHSVVWASDVARFGNRVENATRADSETALTTAQDIQSSETTFKRSWLTTDERLYNIDKMLA